MFVTKYLSILVWFIHIYIIVWVFKWIKWMNFDNVDEINAKIKPHDIDDFFHKSYHINWMDEGEFHEWKWQSII